MEAEVLRPTVDLAASPLAAVDAATANRAECERIERKHVEEGDFVAWLNRFAS